MRYWRHVMSRAVKEAAVDVRLGGASFAVLVVGQGALAAILFFVSGLASANLPTRLASAFLPFLVFPAFLVFRLFTVPAAIDREREAQIAELEERIESAKWATMGGENGRRHLLLSQFRELYKLSEDGLSPDLMAGLAWPPIDWMNDKLGRKGEIWRVDRVDAEKVYTREL